MTSITAVRTSTVRCGTSSTRRCGRRRRWSRSSRARAPGSSRSGYSASSTRRRSRRSTTAWRRTPRTSAACSSTSGGSSCTGGRGLGWRAAGACQDEGMKALIRVLITAVALFVATLIDSGIQLTAGSTASKVGTLVVVALIFGVVNAVLKPIVKTIGCIFYVLTLGLIGLVVNGLLFLLTSWVAGKLSLPFHITGFWAAFWGAIIVGVVGWLLNLFVGDRGRADEDS